MKNNLKEFRSQPPMTADALVLTANEFLAPRGAQLVSKRTLRFYTAQDVVPSPLGSPKFARYGYEHLLSLIGARALQDQGMKLEQIRQELAEVLRGRFDRVEGLVESWLDQGAPVAGRVLRLRERSVAYAEASEPDPYTTLAKLGQASLRIQLTPSCALDISDSASIESELAKAHRELGKLLEKLGK